MAIFSHPNVKLRSSQYESEESQFHNDYAREEEAMRKVLGLLFIVAILVSLVPLSTAIADGPERLGDMSPVPTPVAGGPQALTFTDDVKTALGLSSGAVSSLSFGTSDPDCYNVMSSSIAGFPTQGSSFLAMGTGLTSSITLANTSGSTSYQCAGLNNSQGNDMVQMNIVLNVPSGANFLKFDWKFFSEEFPEFVGTSFNDAFLVETPNSTFTISGNTITAPKNIAFDSAGNLITVNSTGVYGMNAGNASGTTYDGASTTFATTYSFSPGTAQVNLTFSVMDLGDSIYDTMIFLDNLSFGTSDASATATPKPPVTLPVPGVSAGGMGIMALLLAGVAYLAIRRKSTRTQ